MHAEDAPIEPRAAYATSKRYGEEKLIEMAGEGLCPAILRNGTVYGWSPRMRFDLVVNTFVKDALLAGALNLHGGGWMWRPLVDVQDCADAMIAAYEAPAEKVRGEIFNVVHSNYQIRELAMIVAGSVQLAGREVRLEEAPAPKLSRDYECANAKLSTTLGLVPRRSVLESVTEMLEKLEGIDPAQLTDPHALQHPLARTPLRGQAGPRLVPGRPVRALITGGAGQLARDIADRLGPDAAHSFSHAELDIGDAAALERAFEQVRPDVVFNCAAFHNVELCESEPDQAWAVNAARRAATWRAAAPASSTSRPTTSSTGAARSPTRRTTRPLPSPRTR